MHQGVVEKGAFKSGDSVEMVVDHARRSATRANHSATHLIHEALRQILGTHVAQKGSLVTPDRLRFDISHNKAMSPEEMRAVEDMANAYVLTEHRGRNAPHEPRRCPPDRRHGAVRREVRRRGPRRLDGDGACGPADGGQASSKANKAWSVELCGGTHVSRTGDIGVIRIVAESGSAAGVRRIEALTGDGARAYLAEQDARVRELAALMRTSPDSVVERVKALLDERKAMEKQLADAKRTIALGGGGAATSGNGGGGR